MDELAQVTQELDEALEALRQIRDYCLAAPPKDLGGILSLCLQGLRVTGVAPELQKSCPVSDSRTQG